ncbi:hypothetical protein ACH24_03560 [Francisella persica ATCC VR-331]|uniref:Uncharacterized protein n=1 Tax=Francisella persica ATCC VR-331 TaxID=1086726 RepID=A0AAC8ZMN6_9GAMM|nr:hypothetical protein ACH24_03560 [Francisella persica ATCC VR-331]ANH78079.1 hypothetical protein FSC845_06400 [Francisella persica ATCC VR-331]
MNYAVFTYFRKNYNSDVKMVIEHFSLHLFGHINLIEWQRFIEECNQNTNLNLKLSGFDLNNEISNVEKVLDFVFDNISFHQLCYGSNFSISNHNDC